MGSPLAALAAGLAGGYVSGTQQKFINDREAARDRREQETHDAQMAALQRDSDMRASLADAARPAQVDVGADGMTKPATADNIDVGQPGEPGADTGGLVPGALVNGQPAGSPADAAAAAAKANDPNAVTLRQVQAYQRAGKPAEAMALQKNAFTLNKEQAEYARTLKDEGAFDAAKALRQGDAQGMKDAFNKNGKYQIIGDPVITPEQRDIPGVGPITTYNAKYQLQGPDGKVVDRTANSHDMAMTLMPYEKALDLSMKGQSSENTAEYRSGLIDVKSKLADVSQRLADAKEAALKNGSGNLTHEERMRYTTIYSEAGRRMHDAEGTMNTLQRDPMFKRAIQKDPNGPEAMQLKSLQSDLEGYKQERATYQGLLAGSQGSGGQGRAAPAPAAPAAAAQPKSQAEYDALPKGAKYLRDGQTFIKN